MIDLFTLFTARLDAAGVEHMVTGSVAAMVYGEPRLTHDIDLVVMLDNAAVTRLVASFPGDEFYCAPADVIRVEARRRQRGHFNIIHHDTGFKADVYIAGRDPLHRWAWNNRRDLELSGSILHVAPPEYVILRKLEYYREGHSAKHISDIRGMLRRQGDRVDRAALEQRVAALGLEREWAEVLDDAEQLS